jgi:hypothetical protein
LISDKQPKIHLVTFGGGKGYKRSAQRLISQANGNGIFSTCKMICNSDLDRLLPETSQNISKVVGRTGGNLGFGLWIWKPDVILHLMSRTPENEIVLYLDAGCTLNLKNPKAIKRLQDYARLASMNGLFAMQLWDGEFDQKDLSDRYWGSTELRDLIDVSESMYVTNQVQSGIIFVKNCQASRKVIEKWKAIMLQCDFKYLIGEGTAQYRYDQSIFSLLYKASKYPTFPDETYFYPMWEETGSNFPIWATRINDGVDPFKIRARDLLFRAKRKSIYLLKNSAH